MHKCIHAYIQIQTQTHIQTYTHIYHIYVHTDRHTYIQRYIQTYIQTYMQAYIQTDIHTDRDILVSIEYLETGVYACLQTGICAGRQTCTYSQTHKHRHTYRLTQIHADTRSPRPVQI